VLALEREVLPSEPCPHVTEQEECPKRISVVVWVDAAHHLLLQAMLGWVSAA